MNRMKQSKFDKMGEVTLDLIYPYPNTFTYEDMPGRIKAHLANFGHLTWQFKSSILTQMYRPFYYKSACEEMSIDKVYAQEHKLKYDGFVLVDAGGCSFETKARNI